MAISCHGDRYHLRARGRADPATDPGSPARARPSRGGDCRAARPQPARRLEASPRPARGRARRRAARGAAALVRAPHRAAPRGRRLARALQGALERAPRCPRTTPGQGVKMPTNLQQPDGTLETIDGRDVLRYERHLSHPVERVWRAITAPEEIVQWLGEAELEPVEGGTVVVRWLNMPSDNAVVRGTVSAFASPRLLEFDTDIHGIL